MREGEREPESERKGGGSEAMAEVSVVVVGDSQCGKTQLINRFAHSTFSQVALSNQHSALSIAQHYMEDKQLDNIGHCW